MNKKSKVSVSQIYLCVSIVALIIGAFILTVVSNHAPVFAAFKRDGRSAEGTVVRREIEVTQGKTSKGRKKETKRHLVSLSYDGMSVTPHSEAMAGKPIVPGPNSLKITGTVQVATAEYEALTEGSKALVTYLPDKVFHPKLSASVEAYSPFWQRVSAFGLLALGAWAGVMSWRRRVGIVGVTA
jgi:hypothetical protein